MKNKLLVCFICFLLNLSYAQAPLPPPPPKKNAKTKDLIYGDPYNSDNKKDKKSTTKIEEVKSSVGVYEENTSQKSIQNFDIPVSESTNINSIYGLSPLLDYFQLWKSNNYK